MGALISNTFQSGFFGVAGERLTRRVRELGFRAMIIKHVGWFDKETNTSGLLASRLASEATMVEGLVGVRLGIAVANIVTIATGLGIAFSAGWKLTLVVLAMAPLVAFANAMEFIAFKGSGDTWQKAAENANQVASEAITNIRTVISFVGEDRIFTLYQKRLEEPMGKAIRVMKN